MREWIHVSDHVRALRRLLTSKKFGSIFNIGTDTRINNLDLARMVLELTKQDFNQIEYVGDRKGHDFRYALNSSKVRDTIKWAPSINFSDGMSKTVNWYLERFQKEEGALP